MTDIDYRDPDWVAQKLGIEKNTVYKFLQEGTIPALQLGRKWLISERKLEEWLANETENQTAARREAAAWTDRTVRLMDNFSDRAREVIRLAHTEARRYSHAYLGQEHLLLGFAADGQCMAARLLAEMGVTAEKVRGEFEASVQAGQSPSPRRLARTPNARQAMHLAAAQARKAGSPRVGTEHLLLAMLEVQGLGRDILCRLGVTGEQAREALGRLGTGSDE